MYDKQGEEHYNLISALHKSIRNSDADASLYWLGRMLQAGEDPMYVARRIVRMAVEDIGLAAPEALNLCLSARDAMRLPRLTRRRPRSRRKLSSISRSRPNPTPSTPPTARSSPTSKPPARARPAPSAQRPTGLMKELDYGKGYQYAHDVEGRVADMECLPDNLRDPPLLSSNPRRPRKALAQRMEEIEHTKEARTEKS